MEDHSWHDSSHKLSTDKGPLMDNLASLHSAMPMTFHFGTNETLLFDWCVISSPQGLIASCVIVFLIALCYEALKYVRARLLMRASRTRYSSVRTANGVTGESIATPENEPVITMTSLSHLQQTLIYVVQLTLGYLLMLLFMCFNVWICLSVVLGAFVGHFLFGWHITLAQIRADNHCSA